MANFIKALLFALAIFLLVIYFVPQYSWIKDSIYESLNFAKNKANPVDRFGPLDPSKDEFNLFPQVFTGILGQSGKYYVAFSKGTLKKDGITYDCNNPFKLVFNPQLSTENPFLTFFTTRSDAVSYANEPYNNNKINKSYQGDASSLSNLLTDIQLVKY